MALPQSGTELVAKGAATFVKDMDRAEKAQRDLGDEIEHSAGKANKSGGLFSNLGSIIGGPVKAGAVVAATALAAFGAVVVGSIDDAKEAIAAEAELAAVLESTGGAAGLSKDELLDMASALQDVSLFSDEAVLHAESVLLTFTNIGEEAFPGAIQAAADMSQMLGQDLQSSAVQLGKALNDPINGITALSRVGVSFTEEQKEQIKTMTEAGDVAGAQAAILAELNKEFGGQAAAAREAAGPQATWNVLMGEFQESVGKAVLPMLNSLMLALIPIAQQVLPQIVEAFSGFLNVIGQVIAFAAPFVEQFVGGIVSGLSQVGESATGLGGIWQQLQGIIGTVMQIINLTIVPILQGIGTFIGEHSTEIQAVLGTAWGVIQTIIQTNLNVIQGIVNTVLALIKGDWSGAWEEIKKTLQTIWDYITGPEGIVQKAVNLVQSIINLALSAINTNWEEIWTGIKTFVEGIWNDIVNWIEGAINNIIGLINGLIAEFNKLPFIPDIGLIGYVDLNGDGGGGGGGSGGGAQEGTGGQDVRPPGTQPRGPQNMPLYPTGVGNTYNLNMNTTQASQGVIADFRIMQVLAGA